MAGALFWGVVAASSLVLGALLALVRDWPDRVVGLVLALGAGALISAVSFELAQDGVEAGGGVPVAIGLALGAVTFYALDGVVSGSGGRSAAGGSLALGAFLDGIPEQTVLGLGLASGEKVSAGLLAAIFVSNLPEAIGSASAMREAGRSNATVLRLWMAVAVVCALASVAGFAIGDSLSGDLQGAVDGFAAGALLVMLTDSMIPEARKAGRGAGLVTAFGFAVAAGLSGVS
jgi:zinc transporter, ZIP family